MTKLKSIIIISIVGILALISSVNGIHKTNAMPKFVNNVHFEGFIYNLETGALQKMVSAESFLLTYDYIWEYANNFGAGKWKIVILYVEYNYRQVMYQESYLTILACEASLEGCG